MGNLLTTECNKLLDTLYIYIYQYKAIYRLINEGKNLHPWVVSENIYLWLFHGQAKERCWIWDPSARVLVRKRCGHKIKATHKDRWTTTAYRVTTLLGTNMTGWNIHHLKMYFLLNIGSFQMIILVFRGVIHCVSINRTVTIERVCKVKGFILPWQERWHLKSVTAI